MLSKYYTLYTLQIRNRSLQLTHFLFKFVQMGDTKGDDPKNLSGNYTKLKMIKYR